MNIDIVPVDFVTINKAESIEMVVTSLEIGRNVVVTVYFKDKNSSTFKIEDVRIEGDEYNNWGNSDDYLVNMVLSKLGIKRL